MKVKHQSFPHPEPEANLCSTRKDSMTKLSPSVLSINFLVGQHRTAHTIKVAK